MKNIFLFGLLRAPLCAQLPLPYYPAGPSEISNATQLQGVALCTGTPANAQALVYSLAGLCWQAGPATSSAAPFWLSYFGNGNEGPYTCATGTCNLSGEHWYSSVNVSLGATLADNGAYAPLVIRSTGACTIAGEK
jgi:hypothetical protein